MKQPLFSVVIPVRNRATTLARAIDSVLQQSITDLELLIIDDGSNDRTPELVDSYSTDNRVRYFRQDHQGVSAARNFGIGKARAKYIAFLDSDDQWLPKKLALQYQFFAQNPQFRIVQTNEIWIRNGVRVNAGIVHRKQDGDIFQPSLMRCLITPSSVVMDAQLIAEIGCFDTKLPACEDYDLWLRITARYPIGLVNSQQLIRYAGHADQLSNQYPAMDRFRVYAIHKLLISSACTADQQRQAETVLCNKSSVLLSGQHKRGKDTNLLHQLANQEWHQVSLQRSEEILLSESRWQ